MIFGPTLLGNQGVLSTTMFPTRGAMVLETVATFGLMYFLFMVGVKMDPMIMVRPGRKATSPVYYQ